MQPVGCNKSLTSIEVHKVRVNVVYKSRMILAVRLINLAFAVSHLNRLVVVIKENTPSCRTSQH